VVDGQDDGGLGIGDPDGGRPQRPTPAKVERTPRLGADGGDQRLIITGLVITGPIITGLVAPILNIDRDRTSGFDHLFAIAVALFVPGAQNGVAGDDVGDSRRKSGRFKGPAKAERQTDRISGALIQPVQIPHPVLLVRQRRASQPAMWNPHLLRRGLHDIIVKKQVEQIQIRVIAINDGHAGTSFQLNRLINILVSVAYCSMFSAFEAET